MVCSDEAGADESHAETHQCVFLALVDSDWLAMSFPRRLYANRNVFDYIYAGRKPEAYKLQGLVISPGLP
jgi:hypothetical protein